MSQMQGHAIFYSIVDSPLGKMKENIFNLSLDLSLFFIFISSLSLSFFLFLLFSLSLSMKFIRLTRCLYIHDTAKTASRYVGILLHSYFIIIARHHSTSRLSIPRFSVFPQFVSLDSIPSLRFPRFDSLDSLTHFESKKTSSPLVYTARKILRILLVIQQYPSLIYSMTMGILVKSWLIFKQFLRKNVFFSIVSLSTHGLIFFTALESKLKLSFFGDGQNNVTYELMRMCALFGFGILS